MGKMEDIPVLGDIKVPVRLMRYANKEHPERNYFCNFAHWWAADGTSDVSDNEGNKIGHIGGTMGGHCQMTRYFPNEKENDETIHVIIDVRDIWNQIEELLESKDVQVQLEGMEEVQRKYQEMEKKLREIKDMQKKAEEEEAEKKRLEEEAKKPYKNIVDGFKQCKNCNAVLYNHEECNCKEIEEKKAALANMAVALKESKLQPTENPTITTSNGTTYEILENPHNWDLNESFRGRDAEFYNERGNSNNPNRNKDGRIPTNIGCGVKLKKGNEILYTDEKPNKRWNGRAILNITSWRGISPDAIHYYGAIEFYAPDVHPEGEPNSSTSCWLPIFSKSEIQITRILEQWEIDKYPYNYADWDAGSDYRGFYTPEDVIEKGREVFNDLFASDWKLEIDKQY